MRGNLSFLAFLILLLFHLIETEDMEDTEKNNCSKLCDPVGGICKIDECYCKEEFTTFPSQGKYQLCNYEKKRALYSALIELFLSFGAGHFYSGRRINGSFKLISLVLLCCFSCCALGVSIKLSQDRDIGENNPTVKFFFFIYACIYNIFLLWQVLDFFLFIFKVYNDGNDIPLT
jgi:hypothetical protein